MSWSYLETFVRRACIATALALLPLHLAQAELEVFLQEIEADITCGDHRDDEGHDPEEFRIVAIE